MTAMKRQLRLVDIAFEHMLCLVFRSLESDSFVRTLTDYKIKFYRKLYAIERELNDLGPVATAQQLERLNGQLVELLTNTVDIQ